MCVVLYSKMNQESKSGGGGRGGEGKGVLTKTVETMSWILHTNESSLVSAPASHVVPNKLRLTCLLCIYIRFTANVSDRGMAAKKNK